MNTAVACVWQLLLLVYSQNNTVVYYDNLLKRNKNETVVGNNTSLSQQNSIELSSVDFIYNVCKRKTLLLVLFAVKKATTCFKRTFQCLSSSIQLYQVLNHSAPPHVLKLDSTLLLIVKMKFRLTCFQRRLILNSLCLPTLITLDPWITVVRRQRKFQPEFQFDLQHKHPYKEMHCYSKVNVYNSIVIFKRLIQEVFKTCVNLVKFQKVKYKSI